MKIGIESVSIGPNGGRVRDHVLAILSDEFPLSVKQLYQRVTRSGQEVSYQAVHKVVDQLKKEGVVEKNGMGIQLTQKWIKQVKDYAFTIDTVYTQGKQYTLPAHIDKPVKIEFNDYSTYVIWMAENLRDGKFTGGKTGPIYGIFRHAVWPLRFNFRDFELLRSMNSKCYTQGFCVQDTPFDQWIGQHYKLGGVKEFFTGIKVSLEEDLYAAEDMVVRVSYSPETKKFMDKIYRQIGDMKQLFQFYFSNYMKKEPTHIELTVERNPVFARMIRKQVEEVIAGKKTAQGN